MSKVNHRGNGKKYNTRRKKGESARRCRGVKKIFKRSNRRRDRLGENRKIESDQVNRIEEGIEDVHCKKD